MIKPNTKQNESTISSDDPEIFKMPMLIVGMEKLTTQAVSNILASSYNGL